MRRSSYPASGYSLGSSRSRQARRLLAARRWRHTLRKLGLAGIAFLVVGATSALASTGTHRGGRPPHSGGPPARPAQAAAAAPLPATGSVVPHPVKARTFSSSWLTAHPVASEPPIRGRAAIVVDAGNGQILYAKDMHGRVPAASLAKMMTAMVALDLAPLDQLVTVPEAATRVEPNVMGLSASEQLSLQELLYGLLLDSGNDAAEAIATGILDRSQFIQRMNQKAAALRLKDTRFSNPSGFDDANQYSSPYDLAAVTVSLLQDYPELAGIVGTRQLTIPATGRHKWFGPANLNRLLWSYPGAIGAKPGYTDGAGYCLAAAARRDGRTVVAVVLGSTQHFTDARLLLDLGFRQAPTG